MNLKLDDHSFVLEELKAELFLRYFEKIRWPDGIECPHCGCKDSAMISVIKPNIAHRVRRGLKFCSNCRRQFTATTGTIFHQCHLSHQKLLMAMFIFYSSNKRFNARILQHTIGVTWPTAFSIARKLRALKNIPTKARFNNPFSKKKKTFSEINREISELHLFYFKTKTGRHVNPRNL
jgi:hypothetical protein